jgi:uncharacterized protein YqgC (DUF456 family)
MPGAGSFAAFRAYPRRFLVEPTGAPTEPGGSDLAFGSSIAERVVGTVLPSIGLICLGIIGAIVVDVIRITRVRRARAQASDRLLGPVRS